VEILEKVKKKLTGFDDITEKYLDVENQVQSLIKQATATENLCQLYMGWCPFW
jgi:FKBP12-rapamycin complex-associated protein